MSGTGTPAASASGKGLRLAVVAASWHQQVMAGLLGGATRACDQAGAEHVVFHVPGSFELPLAAQRAARAGFDGVVALGVIIRGGTPHFEYVCSGVTQGLTQVALATDVPVGFGILTCDTESQALDRAGLPGSSEDNGAEAVQAVIGSVVTLRQIGNARRRYPGFTPA